MNRTSLSRLLAVLGLLSSAPAALGGSYGPAGGMYVERINDEFIADHESIQPTLVTEPFSMVAWLRRDVLDGTFRQCCRAEDVAGEPAFLFRLGGGSNRAVHARMPTDESTNQITGAFPTATTDRWILAVLTYDPATNLFSRHAVCRNDVGQIETVSGSTSIVGEARGPAVMKLLGTVEPGTAAWLGGKLGCVSIRPGLVFSLEDAVAMYESGHPLAPRTYGDADLEDTQAIAWNVGLCQNPSGLGVVPVDGARIGSEILNGNYLVQIGDSNMTWARPVAVEGSPVYQIDKSFFHPQFVDHPTAMNGASKVMVRWASNDPKGQERIAVCGRSRVVHAPSNAPVGDQGDVPYGYSHNWFNALALEHCGTLGGVLGMRVEGSGRQPGFDHQGGSFWADGKRSNTQNTDFAREWLNSNQAVGPGRGVLLLDAGEISLKYSHLDGTLIDRAEPMNVGVTHLRCPGCSDVIYRAVEGDSVSTRGEFVGHEHATADANTTEFLHTFDADADGYSVILKSLMLHGLVGTPEVGWRVTIVAGSGERSMAEIVAVEQADDVTSVLLRHPFQGMPADGSVLAFGPVHYAMIEKENLPSEHDWRGVWVHHAGGVAEHEVGAVLLAVHCWRSDVDSWHWAMVGWGGNSFTDMLDALNSDVVGRMMNHLQIDTALLIDGYAGGSTAAIASQFTAFAEAVEEGTSVEAAYVVGNSNFVADNVEKNFHNWAIDQQTDRPAISIVGSPLVGRWIQQFAYSGRHDSAHGSIEVYARCSQAMVEVMNSTVVPGDLTGNGSVGVPDLLLLLAAWGPCPDCTPRVCPADLTGDCTVGVADLLILLQNWR